MKSHGNEESKISTVQKSNVFFSLNPGNPKDEKNCLKNSPKEKKDFSTNTLDEESGENSLMEQRLTPMKNLPRGEKSSLKVKNSSVIEKEEMEDEAKETVMKAKRERRQQDQLSRFESEKGHLLRNKIKEEEADYTGDADVRDTGEEDSNNDGDAVKEEEEGMRMSQDYFRYSSSATSQKITPSSPFHACSSPLHAFLPPFMHVLPPFMHCSSSPCQQTSSRLSSSSLSSFLPSKSGPDPHPLSGFELLMTTSKSSSLNVSSSKSRASLNVLRETDKNEVNVTSNVNELVKVSRELVKGKVSNAGDVSKMVAVQVFEKKYESPSTPNTFDLNVATRDQKNISSSNVSKAIRARSESFGAEEERREKEKKRREEEKERREEREESKERREEREESKEKRRENRSIEPILRQSIEPNNHSSLTVESDLESALNQNTISFGDPLNENQKSILASERDTTHFSPDSKTDRLGNEVSGLRVSGLRVSGLRVSELEMSEFIDSTFEVSTFNQSSTLIDSTLMNVSTFPQVVVKNPMVQTVSAQSGVRTLNQSYCVGSRLKRRQEETKKRILRQTLVIVITYAICWAPYAAMVLWHQIDEKSAYDFPDVIARLFFTLAVANSTVDPYIYGRFLRDQASKRNHREASSGSKR